MSKIDWNVELDKAILNEPSAIEYQRLFNASSGWVTFAVGSKFDIILHNQFGKPLDHKLSLLRYVFYRNIKTRQWNLAKQILQQIEERSAKLIIKSITNK